MRVEEKLNVLCQNKFDDDVMITMVSRTYKAAQNFAIEKKGLKTNSYYRLSMLVTK